MVYESTRNSEVKMTSAQAIIKGISSEGGLFVPATLPVITADELKSMSMLGYREIAETVFKKFLTDFSDDEIVSCVKAAYGKNFDVPEIAKTVPVADMNILELWHGPTSAFKDMALQILPHLMTTSMKKTSNEKEIIILTATSGDTGKAALEGFADVPGIKIAVFYPESGVSEIQKLQMTTQEGENVLVCAVKGNFDDCQTAVKEIFTDESIVKELTQNGKAFSSANSINLGRLIPQVVYYVSGYLDMVKNGTIGLGDKINVCVPTGNFGNILAAFYAKEMGIPVNKLICASNRNNILTDFINTGVYDKNRDFYTTMSPSMDILISSNLERLVHRLYDNNSKEIVTLYKSLAENGKYTVNKDVKSKLQRDFIAGYCDDEDTKKQIKATFDKSGYLLDTHTAVAVKVYENYRETSGDKTPTLIASTANPYKFSTSIVSAFGKSCESDFEAAEMLNKITGVPIPENITALRQKTVRFSDVMPPLKLKDYVLRKLGN
jgi:threonine synthase